MAKKGTPFFSTWALALVAVGLLYYVFFVEMKKPPEAADTKPKEKVLAFDRRKANALELTPPGGTPIRAVKEGEAWTITAPSTLAADAREVDGVLTSLEGLEVQDVIAESPKDLVQYGLQPPKGAVAVSLTGATKPLELELGQKTPDGSGLYARVPSRPRVFTIAAYQETSFQKTLHDLRDRDVLHLKKDTVTALEVAGPEGGYTLQRDPQGTWAFTRPVATRAGRWSVDGIVTTLESLRFESVAAEKASDKELKGWGLLPPARVVTVTTGAGAQVLQVGAATADGKYYAKEASRPTVFVIPTALADDLAKGMGALRARRLLDIATYEVEGFEVEAPGKKKTFARTASKDASGTDSFAWKRDGASVETNKLQDALFLVGGEEVAEFIDAPGPPATYGLDKPALKVTLRFEKGKPPLVDKPPAWFTVGQKDGAFYARRNDDDVVLKLDPKKAPQLLKAFGEL